MATSRFRLRFPFWLDMQKKEEADLADTIQELKDQRAFASSVRDGLRLIVDLRAGRLDTLLELFPWVAERLMGVGMGDGNSDLKDHMKRLEQLLLDQRRSTTHQEMRPLGQGGLKPMSVPKVDLPRFDDEDDADLVTVKEAVVDPAQISKNFMESMGFILGE